MFRIKTMCVFCVDVQRVKKGKNLQDVVTKLICHLAFLVKILWIKYGRLTHNCIRVLIATYWWCFDRMS
jgi:hypothetical protein